MLDAYDKDVLNRHLWKDIIAAIVKRHLENRIADESRLGGDEGTWYGNRWGRDAIGRLKSRDANGSTYWFDSRWGRK